MSGLQLHRIAIVAFTLGFGVAACQRSDAQKTQFTTGSLDSANIAVYAKGLEAPWGLAFLPDGRALVTERPGRLRLVSPTGGVSQPILGVPAVVTGGQGGLLDVAIDPEFVTNQLVYLSYSEAGNGGAGTAVARGKLTNDGLENVEVIWRQVPKVSGGNHFGSRLVFARMARCSSPLASVSSTATAPRSSPTRSARSYGSIATAPSRPTILS